MAVVHETKKQVEKNYRDILLSLRLLLLVVILDVTNMVIYVTFGFQR